MPEATSMDLYELTRAPSCFAAAGTRARDLVDGARTLKMFGGYVPVRAEVADVPHFSAHADASHIIDWQRGAPAPHTTYLVHGEETAARTLRDRIDRELGWTAVVPARGKASWSADRGRTVPAVGTARPSRSRRRRPNLRGKGWRKS
ncbi:MBL fold metallo-hydrolase RNA specificity domain-containing protein [Streptomyces sp. NPDC055059]|jgi:hypothetical protein|uniref:MBL fold metallo-hydrolase RNA specificity domain-containing protein n=1 Tax=Streptomyces sp. NPDC127172 TaxID=3345382 RepID=UPI003637D7E4